MRPDLVLAAWLALAGLQASAAPFRDGHALDKRQSDTGGAPTTPPADQQPSAPTADPPSQPADGGGGDATPAPNPDPAPEQPSTPAGGDSPTPADPTPAPADPTPAPADPTPAPADPSPQPSPNQPSDGGGEPSQPPQPQEPTPAPQPDTTTPPPSSVPPTPETTAPPAPATTEAPPPASTEAPPALSTVAPPPSSEVPQTPAGPSPNVPETPAGPPTGTQGVAPSDLTTDNGDPNTPLPSTPAASVPSPSAVDSPSAPILSPTPVVNPPPQSPSPLDPPASSPLPPPPLTTNASPTPASTADSGPVTVQGSDSQAAAAPPSSDVPPPAFFSAAAPPTASSDVPPPTAPPPLATTAEPGPSGAAPSQSPNAPVTVQGTDREIPANPNSSGGPQPSESIPPSPGTDAGVGSASANVAPPVSETVVESVFSSGTGLVTLTFTTPLPSPDGGSGTLPPPPASGTAAGAPASPAVQSPAATGGIGADNTECTTSNGLKGKLGPGGCFANPRQDCTVSDGIPGATTDTGTCAPVVSVGAPCSLSDGTKGTAQLQGLGTSLSCIGDNFGAGGTCALPFNVAGTIGNDGRTCSPPKEAPPPGNACPVPGITGLGVMQSDGKTCLPPTQSGTAGSGGGGSGGSGGNLASGGQCAIAGQPGNIDNGACRAVVSRAGDPCYRGGGGTYFSNAIPDGILGADLKTCLIVNETCNANGVQGRWSPSYSCVVPPPTVGNPAEDGAACQRGQMWGGRWDAGASTCILPGDPCPSGIYGPNARDCIAKPPAGTVCETGQGFNGSFNDAGLCVAIIPPGVRTPCLSVKSAAGTISLTPNGTLCQIAPTPDTPAGLLQDIAPRTYCSNGKDAGAFTDLIECEVQQRPGGLSAIPEGTPGSPRNDISSLQTVTRKTKSNSWIPGVATAAAVVVAALVLGILAKKCGWFSWCARKRRQRNEPPAFGPGEGILEETAYGPQPTYPSVGNQPYRDYNPAPLSSARTATNRMSIVSDDPPTTDPFSDSSYHTLHTQWNQQHPSEYSRTTAGSVSAHPGSPPPMPLSPPGSPPAHVHNEPLLSGYDGNPPAYPAEEYHYNNSSSLR